MSRFFHFIPTVQISTQCGSKAQRLVPCGSSRSNWRLVWLRAKRLTLHEQWRTPRRGLSRRSAGPPMGNRISLIRVCPGEALVA